jgi:hypothetical protein
MVTLAPPVAINVNDLLAAEPTMVFPKSTVVELGAS